MCYESYLNHFSEKLFKFYSWTYCICSPSQQKIDPAKFWLKIPIGISYLGFRVDHFTLILVPKAWQFLLYFMHTFTLQSFIPIMIWWECHTFSIKVVYFQCYCIENILFLSSIPPLSSEFWILKPEWDLKPLRLHLTNDFIATWTLSTNTH